MKKHVRKLSALFLALMLLLTMAVPTMAADENIAYNVQGDWENITSDNSVTMEKTETPGYPFYKFTSHKYYNDARFAQVYKDVVPGTYRVFLMASNKNATSELFIDGEKLSVPDIGEETSFHLYQIYINVPTQKDIDVVLRVKGEGVSTLFSPRLIRDGDATPPATTEGTSLLNPGFEDGLSGWTADAGQVRLDPYFSQTGFNSVSFNYNSHMGVESGLVQTAYAREGTYTASVSLLTEKPLNGLGAMILLEAKDRNGNLLASAISPTVTDTQNTWQKLSATIDAPAGTAQITMKVGGVYCVGSFHIDNAWLAYIA